MTLKSLGKKKNLFLKYSIDQYVHFCNFELNSNKWHRTINLMN